MLHMGHILLEFSLYVLLDLLLERMYRLSVVKYYVSLDHENRFEEKDKECSKAGDTPL